jgi:hypothetical protein
MVLNPSVAKWFAAQPKVPVAGLDPATHVFPRSRIA